MKVFRVEREKYLETTLSGIGASYQEGYRWNSKNTFMVYTSDSRALATLEVAVHLDLSEDLPTDRHYVEIDIPDDMEIEHISMDDLPKDWDSKPPQLFTQYIGDDFVSRRSAPILKVPSAIVSREHNYLINPNHPDSIRIKVIRHESFSFDSRLS